MFDCGGSVRVCALESKAGSTVPRNIKSVFPSLFPCFKAPVKPPWGTNHVSKIAEEAHETIHEHGGHSDPYARRVAVLVSALAAALALTEVGAKSTQNDYLKNHIAVSDDYAFYQARNLRALVKETEARMLSHIANANDPQVQADIKADKEYMARMRDDPKSGDGMKQLLVKAKELEEAREEAFHHYHVYELCGGALEIAIVLASVAVVTQISTLAFAALGIGGIASIIAAVVAVGLV